LYQISLDQDETLIKCKDALVSQSNYITLLEAQYIRHNQEMSPIH